MERSGNAKERYQNAFQIFWGSCSRNYGGELTLVNILGQNNKCDHLSSSPFAAKGKNKFVKFIDDYLRKAHVNATKFYHENIPIFILKVITSLECTIKKMFY